MAEHYSFFDPVEVNGVYDREYNAQEFTDYFGALITTGVMKGAFNMLAVTANGSNMVTSINTGIAFVEAKRYFNDAPLPFPHDTETIGLSRIDRIVVRMDQNVESRYVKAFIKKGTASANPAPPTLTQNNTVYEISLAQIRIVGGQTFIATNAVTDERGTDIICPWVGSNILPSFDDNALSTHIDNATLHIPYVVVSGVTNTYTALIPNVKQYTEGMALSVKINAQNTAAATINVNGLGAKNIIKGNGNAVSNGNLKANSIYTLRYNGTAFILQGEGGEGTAVVSDVLSGKTFTNDSGSFSGTMQNNSNITTGGTRRVQGNGYIDLSPSAGFYDGSSTSRTRISDSNFTAANILRDKSIFGLTGTAETKVSVYTGTRGTAGGYFTSHDFGATMYAGFTIKAYAVIVNNIRFGSYIGGSGVIVDGRGTGYLEVGGLNVDGTKNYLFCNNKSTVSGNVLYGNITVYANYTGIVAQQLVNIDVICWGV